MSRYLIPAIVLAAAPLSLAAAEPTPAPENSPPANCQQMQQMHQGNMQHQMGGGAMGGGSGQMMHHGPGGTGTGHMSNGAMGSGTMQGQMMQHGDHAGMGPGNHQAMAHEQGRCPAASQSPGNSQSVKDK